jgi:hypothetical protein
VHKNETAMPWTVALIGLALAAAASSRTAPQIIYTEGVVSAGGRAIQSQNGRAEALMPDGSVVHIDRHSRLALTAGQRLDLHDGRLLIRTTASGYVDVDLPIARVELTPRGIYDILFDAAKEALLLRVIVGHADIRTSHGVTPVAGREMALMPGARERPYATPIESARWDSFEWWSDERLRAAAYGLESAAGSDPAGTGPVANDSLAAAPACSDRLDWINPCVAIAPPYGTVVPMPYSRPRAPAAPPVDGARDGGGLLAPRPGRGTRDARPEPAAKTPPVKPLPRIIDHTKPSSSAPAPATPRPASGTAVSRPRS